ncbi:GNAT family N-acetyltransferase [Amycolatopsis jiangsuensis]|uniref:GNAT superfamily N-acetyltransferase n=1 Tax=Amycolatopsis jiangsuensis TaxID=1181879 RepID=A0A840ING1_9PSEU|nr:GNAT family N-acetyltransferase [Amycolatopsis jiangsuensis]MBB4682742.1 GNAT superfamily N-acetyltransferase [Amycolatopsis jiangsuensis]
MSAAEVRPATPSDAVEIARIQRLTWRAAYTDLLGADALADLDAADLEGTWAETIGYPDSAVYLATEGSFTVGYCVAGPAPHDEAATAAGTLPEDAGATGLIASLVVEPRWGRRGHAGRLLATAAEGLRAEGLTRGITWVAQSDHATLGFYRRAGWTPEGTVRTLDTGRGTLREVRLTGTLELELTR